MTNRSERTEQDANRNYDIVFEKLRQAVDSDQQSRVDEFDVQELRAIDELRRFSSAVRDPLLEVRTRV